MSWAIHAKQELAAGREVKVKVSGHSMEPRVRHRQEVLIRPMNPAWIDKGDVVLVTVNGRDYLHLVSAVQKRQVQISNNKGHVNGWVPRSKVHGVAII